MQSVVDQPKLSIEIFDYLQKWKSYSSYKAIEKEDRKKLEQIVKSFDEIEKQIPVSDSQYSILAEQFLSLANNIIHLKWQKKDPKTRVDINLKCDSLFNKTYIAFKNLLDLMKAKLEAYNEHELHSEALLSLNDEFVKISILSKIFYEYSVALNNGGELEN